MAGATLTLACIHHHRITDSSTDDTQPHLSRLLIDQFNLSTSSVLALSLSLPLLLYSYRHGRQKSQLLSSAQHAANDRVGESAEGACDLSLIGMNVSCASCCVACVVSGCRRREISILSPCRRLLLHCRHTRRRRNRRSARNQMDILLR